MSDAREYIEPVVIDRDADSPEQSEKPIETEKTVDNSDNSVIHSEDIHDADDPRSAIAEKHARKQRAELGIDEPEARPDALVTVKINGKERQVSQSKVDAAGGLDVYQKRLAAEDKLQEVSLEKKAIEAQKSKLQREAEEFKRWQQQQIQRLAQEKQTLAANAGNATGQPQQGIKPDTALKDLVRKHREALFDGDDDRADELMVQIQRYGAGPKPPPINEREIEHRTYQRIQQRLAQEQAHRDLAKAQQDFSSQYGDIVGDDRLFQMADQETIRLKNQNPSWSDRQVIMQAGENVRQWRDQMMGVDSRSVSGDKTQAKRGMSSARAASGRSPSRPQPRPSTPSEYVESLRASRGQDI